MLGNADKPYWSSRYTMSIKFNGRDCIISPPNNEFKKKTPVMIFG